MGVQPDMEVRGWHKDKAIHLFAYFPIAVSIVSLLILLYSTHSLCVKINGLRADVVEDSTKFHVSLTKLLAWDNT